MLFTLEIEQEDDGRWLAEIPELSGVAAYGSNPEEAIARVKALGLRVIADLMDNLKVATRDDETVLQEPKTNRKLTAFPDTTMSPEERERMKVEFLTNLERQPRGPNIIK
jgi:predicted RNase H-like HicB family nuclease